MKWFPVKSWTENSGSSELNDGDNPEVTRLTSMNWYRLKILTKLWNTGVQLIHSVKYILFLLEEKMKSITTESINEYTEQKSGSGAVHHPDPIFDMTFCKAKGKNNDQIAFEKETVQIVIPDNIHAASDLGAV